MREGCSRLLNYTCAFPAMTCLNGCRGKAVLCWVIPGPKVELLDEEVSHNALHLAEAGGEGRGLVGEGLYEARLILLSEETEDEGLLTRLNDFMSTIHQDA